MYSGRLSVNSVDIPNMFRSNPSSIHSLIIVLIVLFSSAQQSWSYISSIGTKCHIPNETSNGTCTIKENCIPYMNLYINSITTENINFMRELQCDNRIYMDETIVCCSNGSSSYRNPSVVIDLENLPKSTDNKADDDRNPIVTPFQAGAPFMITDRFDQDDEESSLLPQKTDCGNGYHSGKRIFGGDFTSIWEFPWMALLIYNTNSSRPYGCGGSLINNRYILTAAHCVTGQLKGIRLGEYNIETEQDCMPSKTESGQILKCADPVVDVGVEKIIVHPQYNDASRDKHHDIALVRLNTNVSYSKYIKPICLPIVGLSSGLITGNKLTSSGWGSTNVFKRYGDVSSSIKLKVRLPITDMYDCINTYKSYNINIGPGQVCAGGMRAKDSCLGDSGGPLMYYDRKNGIWVASGIVSFGAEKCGTVGISGVYTNVEYYMLWILNTLEK
ncbi:phenoloxidase-activating factor 1 isoform X2 [Contarinia nasturtii]|uniref:phenoloxidase-activating factor 1 isoform X2 n=1 Tax=Contarinia nasturtii TaxID=265458 RepID=UPI0012D42CCA|nr:phenoloxidase-activating factor 1 isoform X2 [Contarinia nasturtii]